MPEIISYKIIQTREVNVRANSLEDAIRIANVAFKYGQNADSGVVLNDESKAQLGGIWGNTTGRVKEKDIWAERTTS